jgi:elongation factor G
MSRYSVDAIRNIVLVGHGAGGKTTLADHVLFKAGQSKRAGSVDDHTSLLDTDDDEKERKHSINSHLAHFDHQGRHINIIDAPGYPDFISHTIAALSAVETAVIVLNAAAGVEVNARRTFQLATEAGKAVMIVVNKCDTENVKLADLLAQMRQVFGNHCVMMNVPCGLGSKFETVVSTINPPEKSPEGCCIDPRQAGQEVIDAAVEADAELMAKFFEGEALTKEEIAGAIKRAIAHGDLIPVFCISAKKDLGIVELMDGLAEYAPSPVDLPLKVKQNGQDVSIEPKEDGPVVARVFKTRIDPFVSRMSFVRVFSGTIKKDASLKDERNGKSVKAHQMLDMQGAQYGNVNEAGPGELVVIVKAEDVRTQDVLTSGIDNIVLPPLNFPIPMISLAVEPKSQADQQKISGALHKIEDEDATFTVSREAQTHEMVMHGMSELHLQLVQNRLHNREKVDVIVHAPKVPYHETVTTAYEGSYRHKKQSGGAGQFAEVHFRISPCPQGINPEEYFTSERFPSLRHYHYDPAHNFCFIDRVTGGSVPNQFIPAVEKGLKERLERGVLAGFQVQDVVVELFFGKDHPVDSNENAFKTAARMCFKEVFLKAKPALLEPIVHLDVTIPQEKLGDITSDLNTRRGRMEGMDGAPGGMTVVKARAPLAEVMTYARSLSSMTGGQGSFTMEFSHYEPLPAFEQQKIVAGAKMVEEEV